MGVVLFVLWPVGLGVQVLWFPLRGVLRVEGLRVQLTRKILPFC